MNKPFALCLIGLAGWSCAQAQEWGRVISSTPVIQQVAVPRQVCTQQPVAVQQPSSGAGALMGAIAGGAVGNAVGDGSGRALATIVGVVGGAMLGDRVEGTGTQLHQQQHCTTQTYYENRAVAYNVVYEYAGKQYQVQMPHDPGPSIQLQVTPVGSMPPPPVAPATVVPAPVVQAPVFIAPPVQTVVTVPHTVVHPSYYHRPWRPPVTVHLGYAWGGHRHPYRHHRHWR